MDGELYPTLCRAIKAELPGIHIHGFSPEEVVSIGTVDWPLLNGQRGRVRRGAAGQG